MLAGGAEALFAFVSIKAWLALQVLAPARAENIAATCRPFSRDRNGTVLGDGAVKFINATIDYNTLTCLAVRYDGQPVSLP